MGKQLDVNPIYEDFFFNEDRYAVLYGGAGSGKSYIAVQKIVIRVLSEENHRFLVVRKVARTLRASVFQLFKDVISSLDAMENFVINKTDLTITNTLNNSQILFIGMDSEEKVKSIAGITSLFLEEASELSESEFSQLNLRLRGESKFYKQIILAFNPVSTRSWLKQYFFDNPKKDTYILKTTYRDNRSIDSDYVAVMESLKESNYSLYQVYGLGLWGVLRGVIYPKFTEIDKMPEITFDHYGIGVDFGYTDPSTATICAIHGDNLYIDEVVYQSGLITREIIEMLPKETYIYCDAAEPDRITEMRRAGLWAEKGIKDVIAGINRVKSYNIFVTKQSVNLIRDLQTYSWKVDKDGNTLDAPNHLNSDGPDGIRYAVHSMTQDKAQTKTFVLPGL